AGLSDRSGRSVPDLDGVSDKLGLARRYGRRGLAAERGAQDPVQLPRAARAITHEANALALGFLERHIVIAGSAAGQSPAAAPSRAVLQPLRRSQPIHRA